MALMMEELIRAAQLGGKRMMEEVSWRDLLNMSYEAGGVYPTIVGYILGGITIFFFTRCSSWISRLVPAALCSMLFLHTLHNLERKSLEWLLMVAAGTGVCCTYMQLSSLDLVREHFAFKKVVTKPNTCKKND
ncbi:hypothetical protein F441_11304 [Phytophthora nicotianae CJ01A1]|uniref:Uncharacterized protein n=6 Tax=Phytophthora nicotianae TaxID=4792 RepID=W2Q3B9_PHYN3|nr:hypothetical protein PPTG_13464 [Phytophthora nicotianae INRA-310]ETI43790.1 hypothetical protein F443_11387 [Phytophthora nicotianae P1569]ETK83855.1 hypothetical protein L915_11077 [Phytophthora nicotianae]ETO72466.1 hypothetical protein F444_11457 [Phytophthora nicotianae P1976]ETP13601.1 hypothetical protein F441_11304 [Phytophthora nicotianae CJ01A1]ETP41664.1 hypothetical protein F442_11272 [Phytophthora nicotianae P10297]